MISIGTNIQDITDILSKLSIEDLSNSIKQPSQEVRSLIGQLRVINQVSPAQYRNLKRQLPYFVCAIFNPPHRKTENFAYTQHFIVDLDHLSQKGLAPQALRDNLSRDPLVTMCFVSPSRDGLKVMFTLSDRCYDPMLYKVFYKTFAEKWAAQHGLQQVVDMNTCDVTRACFMSHDENIYFNPHSTPVGINDYVDVDNPLQALQSKKTGSGKSNGDGGTTGQKESHDPDKETMQAIRQTLNPNATLNHHKAPAHVPQVLTSIMPALTEHIENLGVKVTEVIDINYGKKMRFSIALRNAEVNVFYGKKGFSVVQSPRTGTDPELNQLMADVIVGYIAGNM
ncbi:MAG: virulence protein E [Muribaculaceae bacterium]|nr:virulence protein E [Muribaculaceae bacterium]